MPRATPRTVDEYLAALEHPELDGIRRLRARIRALAPEIVEEVKWNAPSFALGARHATMRLHPAPHFQLILHTGSGKSTRARRIPVADPNGLLAWAAPDRAVLTIGTGARLGRDGPAILAVVRAWLLPDGG